MDADLWERFSTRIRIEHIPRYLACMRFYPQQKTRSRRGEGRGEDRTIRARHAHALGTRRPVEALLRVVARCVRVSAKAFAGGYTARVSGEHLAWLGQRSSGDAGK
jgi:hypothetical protein